MNLRLSILLIASLQFPFDGYAGGEGGLSWNYGGTVYDSSGKTLQLDMQSAYDAIYINKALYLIGFYIDKNEINYSRIAKISTTLKDPVYWPFDHMLEDIFVFNDKLYTSDSEGSVFTLIDSQWRQAAFKFKPESIVVYANRDLVACYPSQQIKASPSLGGCYSLSKGWHTQLDWRSMKPEVCEHILYVFEENGKGKVIKQLDLEHGKVLVNRSVTEVPHELCGHKEEITD
ncbi:MAG: hypothetical protein P8179_02480 [Candidatus Thiodiazotropha sp.]